MEKLENQVAEAACSLWFCITGTYLDRCEYLRSHDPQHGSRVAIECAGAKYETTLPTEATIRDIYQWMLTLVK